MGQVNRSTGFGRFLEFVARERTDLIHFVEVGTWDGAGSTRCIADGLSAREGGSRPSFMSFEADAGMYAVARKSWEGVEVPFDLSLIRGRIAKTMSCIEDVRSAPGYEAHHEGWFDGEKVAFESATYAAKYLPGVVDFVLLDGGEYSTAGDWTTIKERWPKVVALDDTKMFKTREIVEELEESPEWVRIAGDDEERNGWRVYERV
jgi:hypothetical protein